MWPQVKWYIEEKCLTRKPSIAAGRAFSSSLKCNENDFQMCKCSAAFL